MLRIIGLFFSLYCFLGIGTYSARAADQWMSATVKTSTGASLLQVPETNGRIIGKYLAGTKIKVSRSSNNSYYKVYFQSSAKGAQYGWISEKDVEIQQIEKLRPLLPIKHVNITPSLGYANTSFRQTSVPDFNMASLRGSMAIHFRIRIFPILIEPAVDASYTLLSFSQSRLDVSARLLDSHAKLGLGVSIGEFEIMIFGGMTYTEFKTTGSLFGFKPITYPEGYPHITWHITAGFTLFGYGKYIPFSEFSDSSQSEISWGFGLTYQTSPINILSLRADGGTISFISPSSAYIVSSNLNLSLGYSFSF